MADTLSNTAGNNSGQPSKINSSLKRGAIPIESLMEHKKRVLESTSGRGRRNGDGSSVGPSQLFDSSPISTGDTG